MNVNWKVRIRNRMFWLALIPAVLILVETVCGLFGVDPQIEGLKDRLLDLVNAVFAVLVILGIVADPTTEGIGDSARAMTYEAPWSDAETEPVEKE